MVKIAAMREVMNGDRSAYIDMFSRKLLSLADEIEALEFEIEKTDDATDEGGFIIHMRENRLAIALKEYKNVKFWYSVLENKSSIDYDVKKESAKELDITDLVMGMGFEVRRGFMKCPFHDEKSASLKLYSNSYYCFGCGEGGDNIDFVMKSMGKSFVDAINYLS